MLRPVSIAPIWSGKTAVVIGSGPSLSLKQIAMIWQAKMNMHIGVIAVNDNYQIAPWADWVYGCDYKFWQWHHQSVLAHFDGRKCTTDAKAAELWPVLDYLVGEDRPGWSCDYSRLHYGKNSGYQAVNLAFLLGAVKIILVGFDHCFPGNCAHWFGDHPDKVRSWYENWTECWQSVVPQAKDHGIEIINSTPESALKVFPARPLISALNGTGWNENSPARR